MKLQLFVLAFIISFCIAQKCTDIPVAKCNSNPPAIVLPLDSNGEYQITTNDINNGSTTTCLPISLSLRNAPVNNLAICNTVDFIPPYPLTIFLLVSSAGSTQPSICVSRFEVVDQIAPTAVCKPITVGSNTVLTASMVDGGSFDNCDIKSRIINVTSVGACDQTVGVLLTVSDYSGNVDHCETTITVVDSIAPQAKCHNSTQNVGDTGTVTISSNQANLIDNGSFDNCDGTNIDLQLTFPGDASSITRTCLTLGTAIVGLEATDSAGNVGSCSANIFFKDLSAPNAVCNDISVDVGVDFIANITAKTITGDSSDTCGIASYGSDVQVSCDLINYTYNPFSGFLDGSPTVVPISFVVSDHSENENTCSSKITVTDNTPPVAKCITSFTVNVGDGYGYVYSNDIDDNSYDVCEIIYETLSEGQFTCADVGTRNVTLTVFDPFNNTDSCTSLINIVDLDSPYTLCTPTTIDVGATPSGVYTVHPSDGYLIDDGSEDACTNITTTLNIARDLDINCNMLGIRDFTLIATDAYGNIGTCPSSIFFVDNTPPTLVCAATAEVDIGNGVNHYFTSQFLMAGTTDVCGVTYTPVEHLFNCTKGLGNFIVTSTASDPSGNKVDCKTNVTVVDTVEPNPECKLNAKLNVGATGTANATTTVIDNGSFDACSNVTLKIINSQANFTCSDIGSHDVILQVSDTSNNVATCTAPLEIVDSSPPTAVCKTYIADVGSSPGGFVVLNVDDGKLSDGGSSDICTPSSDLEFTYDSPISGSCASIGSRAPKLFVTDAYGNQASCVANVTFLDLTPPEVACATLTILNVGRGPASPILSHVATASDICGPLFYSTTNATTYSCADIGDHDFTVFVKDGAGNQGFCTTLLRVVDNTPPAANCANTPFNLTVGTGYGILTTSNVNSGSTDTCDPSPTLSLDKSNFTCSDVGVRTVTLTVKDVSNNTDTCQSVINVVDTTKPSPVCKDIVVNVGDDGSQTLTTADGKLVDNGSADICSPVSLALNQSYTGTCGTLGQQKATLIVTDASGNQATCTSNINFADLTPPSIKCRAEVTINVGSNSVAFVPRDAALTYFDNCMADTGVYFSANQTTFTCANIGKTKVNVTITDGSGNEDSCTTTIIGEDHVGPVAMCNLLVPIEVGTGSATITNSTIDNSSVDLCGGTLTRSLNQTLFTCAQAGLIVPVQLSLADQYGNPSFCVGTVILTDTVKPTALCKDITVYLDTTGNVVISASALNNGSHDCSGAVSFSATKTAFKCADKGANSVTLTVTDPHGNSATCTSIVTVVDNIIPSAKCKNVIATGNYSPTAASLDNGSSDNCGVVSSLPVTTLSSIGGVLTLFATDPSGNVDTCTSQITIQFGASLVVTSGQPLASTSQLAEHIPFEISWVADVNVPAGTLVTLGLINSKNSFFYTIAENVQFDRLQYVVSNGITDVTADQDYLIVMYVPGKTDYASKAITLIRYPTNHP